LNEVDPGASNQAFLETADFLAQFPEIVSMKLTQDRSLWGLFQDGQIVVIVNNRVPSPGPLPRQSSGPLLRASELPAGNRALLANTFVGSSAYTSPIPQMLNRFSTARYAVNQGAGVEALRNSGLLDLFYIDAHGANSDDVDLDPALLDPSLGSVRGVLLKLRAQPPVPNDVFTVWTQTKATAQLDEDYQAELKAKTLVHFLSPIEPKIFERRYGITPNFVRQHMRFGQGSLVFVNACSSYALSFRHACFDSGASVYMGWSEPVLDRSALAASQEIFEGLLISPSRTPSVTNLSEALSRLISENLDVDPNGSRLEWSQNQNPGLPALALLPSLRRVDQADGKLILEGEFGSEPGEVVTNEGSRLLLLSPWNYQRLECSIPPSGQSVRVVVRGRPSNSLGFTLTSGTASADFSAQGSLLSSSEPIYPAGSLAQLSLKLVTGEVKDAFLRAESPSGSTFATYWGTNVSTGPGSPLNVVSGSVLTTYDRTDSGELTGRVLVVDFSQGTSPGSLIRARQFSTGPDGEPLEDLVFQFTVDNPPPPSSDE
jgi:hypothetical protein